LILLLPAINGHPLTSGITRQKRSLNILYGLRQRLFQAAKPPPYVGLLFVLAIFEPVAVPVKIAAMSINGNLYVYPLTLHVYNPIAGDLMRCFKQIAVEHTPIHVFTPCLCANI
jgi:hypothetical protein